MTAPEEGSGPAIDEKLFDRLCEVVLDTVKREVRKDGSITMQASFTASAALSKVSTAHWVQSLCQAGKIDEHFEIAKQLAEENTRRSSETLVVAERTVERARAEGVRDHSAIIERCREALEGRKAKR